MKKNISLMWFRQDLRLSDNPAFVQACHFGSVLPIYIFDDAAPEKYRLGAASKAWLHYSLTALNKSLDGNLHLYQGAAEKIIETLIKHYEIKKIFFTLCYEPWHLDQQKMVEQICTKYGVAFQSYQANYLWSPQAVLKDDGTYYKVFTAYKRKALSVPVRDVVATSKNIAMVADGQYAVSLDSLKLIPSSGLFFDIQDRWSIGEQAAFKKLKYFIAHKLDGYKHNRDFPAMKGVSELSPHLHFGEISPVQILKMVQDIGTDFASKKDVDHFISEIVWREFSCYLMYHFKKLHYKNFTEKFDNFAWGHNAKLLTAWQQGQTGYPLVDAGMRELLQTGYMHNRVRMVVASFLIKNLNVHWHDGMMWFWQHLVDADLANNSASWQWVAGSGADAAPYFRIFNSTTQAKKFDAQAEYIKQFVPEVKNLPLKYLFEPWLAPEHILKNAKIILGKDYPKPIVDLAKTRKESLEKYKEL